MPRPSVPRPQSNDDLRQVSALEAAEARARAALRLADTHAAEKAELQKKLEAVELQRQLDAVARAAHVQPKVELAPDPKPSQRPGVLTVQAKGLKVGIPIALLIPLLTGAWAVIQQVSDFHRQFKVMQTSLVARDTRLESAEKRISDQAQEIAVLRETQAAFSGYLTGVLPKAGVNVPGTGSPIQADPLPAGARRPTPVNVRTPVPTPPPK